MIRFLTAGESHGVCLLAVVEGLPAGLPIDVAKINKDLARRQQGYGRSSRMQIEHDCVEILSGVWAGQTTGSPIALRIENRGLANQPASDLPKLSIPRPGHADYAGMIKLGLDDARTVLERASARETAARVAVGALTKQLLDVFGIFIGSYVMEIGGVMAVVPDKPLREIFHLAEHHEMRCPDADAARQMQQAVKQAGETGDSLGGVFVVVATGAPVGLGSCMHWDRRLDTQLAAAMMSIPAIKGVEIGPAFDNARLPGSEVHDELYPDGAGVIKRVTNRAGGIEGGMSNGAPILVRAAMKPIPTTLTPRHSVDLATGLAVMTHYQRSDVCAVPAAAVVGEAMMAWVIAAALIEKCGGDTIREMQQNRGDI